MVEACTVFHSPNKYTLVYTNDDDLITVSFNTSENILINMWDSKNHPEHEIQHPLPFMGADGIIRR